MSIQKAVSRDAAEPFALSDWPANAAERFGTGIVPLSHRLAETGLFSDAALTDLIDRHPGDARSLVHMGTLDGERRWRLGRMDGISSDALLDHLRTHPLWLNLRAVERTDERYGALFQSLLAELNAAVPNLEAYPGKMGILISGPGTCVDYHADLPGQALYQVRGQKTVYVYPALPPYLSPEQLQDIAYDGVERLPHRPVFEHGAKAKTLGPGEALHWPLNAPHRVENGPMLNVSVTFEYFTDDIARAGRANLANAILRRWTGLRATDKPTHGPAYLIRHAFQAAVCRAGLLQRSRAHLERPSFALVEGPAGGLVMREKGA